MMVGAMPVGRSYPGTATVAGLVQLEGARAAWKLPLNFFLSYNYFSLLSYFFIAFSFLSRKSNVMVKCVTEVTQRLDVDDDFFFLNITLKNTLKICFYLRFGKTTQRLLTRRCNLEAIILESSHFCQLLFEGNFTITPEWVKRPKLP